MATVEEGPLPYNLWQRESSSSSSSSSSNPTDAVLFAGISLLIGVSCRTLLRRTTIPYTVVLLIIGIALGSLEFGSNYRLGNLGNGIQIWADIDADLLLAVFLPILIFEGAFSMEVHQIKNCMAQMLLLAGPGVLISTVLIGASVKLVFPYDWNWKTSLLLGAVLSATDPVAVVALLKDLGASKKLSTIVEGESMMNDGAAIVVYQLFYRMVLGKSFGWVAVLEYLAEGSLGSVMIGLVFGIASLFWLRFIYNDTLTDFSLALTVSYIAYYTAQEEAEASGILTLVALGMVFAMSKDPHRAGGKQSLHEFWEMIAYIANTLIFILSGVIIAQSIFSIGNLDDNTGRSWGYVFLLYIILQVARTIVVFAFYPALCYFGYGLNWKEAIIIIWSGLRGAVGLALSLSIKGASGDPKYLSSETGAMFVFLTGGSVLLTLIINGSTTQLLLSLFGMDALSESEETMVNYAKYQLLRKAEEFSRICSGSNNPFDWITVGGYATCIKDVSEDTVWPPCTTNHGYLEIDDMKTMRVCFLKATREAYWSTFSKGKITESTISVLMESIDEAIDLATQGLHDWNYISTRLKFPGYYKFFSTSVCPPRLTRWFVLKKLQDSCHICSAFIHAHGIARQLLLDYTGDNGNAAIVVAESEVEELEARKFLENVKNSMPEIIHQTESRQVTFSMLKCLDECLSDMEKDGILTEKVVMHVHDLLQNDLEKLLRSPPSVRIPKPGDVLSIHPLLGNLSPAIQSDLERSANSILKTPGCTLYTKGSKLTSVWLIGNGSETMVNYAKYQLLRKAEEFSRICSGSNNPFDWITVGGYATCIKDVSEDTVWPPCTTNHGYLEIDDMKTMRVCFLKATREAYWSTFSKGKITESTISVLMESIDEAIDLATQGLHDWNYISTRLKFPGYYKFFSTSVCPPRLTRWFVLKKLQDSCHICSAFIHAHGIARQLLLDYTGDNGNAAIVVAESEVEELEARKFLENVKNSMPEIIHQTESRQVTFSMLKCLDECLSDMEKDGILTEKVVMHVHDLLQNDLEKLLRSPPSVRIPKPGDVLSIHPLLGNLSPAIQSDLERSANSILKTPGCTLYTKGSKLTSVWLIGNGSVRSKRSSFPIHCPVDSTYHRGSVLGLYEALVGKPYLCDMVTDSVALCIEIKLESIISVLARGNGVEELLWKECTIVVSKLLAPDMFEKFSMQEVRSIVDERSVMNTFSSQEVIETSHHSINFLLSGCLRDQSTEQLIECPAVLPCSILSESIPYTSTNVTGEASGSYSYSKYKVVKPARIVRIDISAA